MYKKISFSDGYSWCWNHGYWVPVWYVCALGDCIDIQRVCEYIIVYSLYKRDVQVPRQCYVHIEGEGLYLVYFVHKQLYFYVVKLETTGTANLMFLDANVRIMEGSE